MADDMDLLTSLPGYVTNRGDIIHEAVPSFLGYMQYREEYRADVPRSAIKKAWTAFTFVPQARSYTAQVNPEPAKRWLRENAVLCRVCGKRVPVCHRVWVKPASLFEAQPEYVCGGQLTTEERAIFGELDDA